MRPVGIAGNGAVELVNKVLHCALEGGAEYVVTGNSRDFPKEFQGIRILPPRQVLLILAAYLE